MPSSWELWLRGLLQLWCLRCSPITGARLRQILSSLMPWTNWSGAIATAERAYCATNREFAFLSRTDPDPVAVRRTVESKMGMIRSKRRN